MVVGSGVLEKVDSASTVWEGSADAVCVRVSKTVSVTVATSELVCVAVATEVVMKTVLVLVIVWVD